jgi:hypothetical protein
MAFGFSLGFGMKPSGPAGTLSLSNLLRGGPDGLLFDPSVKGTLWRTSAMDVPARPGDAVGFMLDQGQWPSDDLGDVYGPELVTNGDFSKGLSGFVDDSAGTGSVSVVGGRAVVSATDGANRGAFSVALTGLAVGATYNVSYDHGGSRGYVAVTGGLVLSVNATDASHSHQIKATATTAFLIFYVWNNIGETTYDNISVREIVRGNALAPILGPDIFTDKFATPGQYNGVGVSLDFSGEGILATNNNTYSGRWSTKEAIIEPGKTYLITATVSEFVGGEDGFHIQIGDQNLNNNASAGMTNKGSPTFGLGTHSFVFHPDAATAPRHVGTFNKGSGGAYGHRCTELTVREIPGYHATQDTASKRPIYGVMPEPTVGPELVTTPLGGAGWGTYLSSWSLGDGTATADGSGGYSHVALPLNLIVGETYRVSLRISEYTSGTVGVNIAGNGAGGGFSASALGVFSKDIAFNPDAANNVLIRCSPSFVGTITDVSVRRVQKGRRNILTYTDELSNAVWSKRGIVPQSGLPDPFGGNTAWFLNILPGQTDAALMYNVPETAVVKDNPHTFSMYMRSRSGTKNLNIRIPYAVGPDAYMPCVVTTEWQRFTASCTKLSSGVISLHVGGWGTLVTGEDIEIAGIQFEEGTIPSAYQRVGSAYDVTDFTQRRNLINAGSQSIRYWSKGANVSISASPTVAPDGTSTAYSVVLPDGGTTDFLRTAGALMDGKQCTLSFYAKSDDTGAVIGVDKGNVYSLGNFPLTSTWKRYTTTFMFPAGGSNWFDFQSAVPVTFFLWGIQLEEGSVATSYESVGEGLTQFVRKELPSVHYLHRDGVDDFMTVNTPNELHGTAYTAATDGTAAYEGATLPAGSFDLGKYFPGSEMYGFAINSRFTEDSINKTRKGFRKLGAGDDYWGVQNVTNYWRSMDFIRSFPDMDFSKLTTAANAWKDCTNLTEFPGNSLEGSDAANFSNAFTNTNLSQESIDGILTTLDANGVSSGTFNQSGGASPSLAGRAAIENMRARGWDTSHAVNALSDLYYEGDAGVVFDPSAEGTLWTTSSMTTPALPGDVVGMMLDQSGWQGEKPAGAYGPERIPDVAYANAAAWTIQDPSITLSGGSLRFNDTPTVKYCYIPNVAGVGTYQKVEIDVESLSKGKIAVEVNGTHKAITSTGTHTFILGPTSSGGTVGVYANSSGGTTAVIRRFSVKKVDIEAGLDAALGSELVINGTFGSDTAWTKGAGWSISGGKAVSDGSSAAQSNFSQNAALTTGSAYLVSADIVVNSGEVYINIGGYDNTGPISVTGHVSKVIWMNNPKSNTTIYALAVNNFSGSIDNLSVREISGKHAVQYVTAKKPIYGVRPKPLYGPNLITNGSFAEGASNWITNVSGDAVPIAGLSDVARIRGNGYWYQSIPTVPGQTYRASFEIAPSSSIDGAAEIRVGTSPAGWDILNGPTVGIGKHEYEFTAIGATSVVSLKTHHAPGYLDRFTDFKRVSVQAVYPSVRNLLNKSELFSEWAQANVAVAGTTVTYSGFNTFVSQSISGVAGETYTCTCMARLVSGTVINSDLRLSIYGNLVVGPADQFGDRVMASPGEFVPVSVTVVSTGGNFNFQLRGDKDGVVVEFKDCQVEVGSARTAYQRTRSRYDVVEPRRNLLSTSVDFSGPLWAKDTGATITEDYGLAPDGTRTAARVVLPGGALTRIWSAFKSPTTNTFSFWAKNNGGATGAARIYLREIAFGATYGDAAFTLTDEWQRFSVTGDCSASTTVMALIYTSSTAVPEVDMLFWHPQAEAGKVVTDYQHIDDSVADTDDFMPPIHYLSFDGVDDALNLQGSPFGYEGTLVSASAEGVATYAVDVPENYLDLGTLPGSEFLGMTFHDGAPGTVWSANAEQVFGSAHGARDFADAVDVSHVWRGLRHVSSFPAIPLRSAVDAAYAWEGCADMTEFNVATLQWSPVTNLTGAFNNTNLSQDVVDDILMTLNNNGTSSGTFDQSGGAAPSATGRAAIAGMRGRGWTTGHTVNELSDLFHAGDEGVLFDPSVKGTLWRSTSMDAMAQPGDTVGLMLDQSQWDGKTPGNMYGPELLTDGGFDGGSSGWRPYNGASGSAVNGAYHVVNGGEGVGHGSDYLLDLVIGKVYEVCVTLVSGPSGQCSLRVGPFGTGNTTNGSVIASVGSVTRYTFTATHEKTYISLVNAVPSSGSTSIWDDVSLREVTIVEGFAPVLGPELAANGTFESNANGWNLGANWAYDAANKRLGRTGSTYHNAFPTDVISQLVVGRQYVMEIERGGGPVGYYTESGSPKGLALGTQSIPFTYKGGNYPFFYASSANGWIDNVSVREIPGNHAVQATASKQPTYGVRPAPSLGEELLPNGDFSDWTATVPEGFVRNGTPNGATYINKTPSGKLQIVSNGDYIGLGSYPITVGAEYEVTVDVEAVSSGTLEVYSGEVRGEITKSGVYTFTFTGTDALLDIKRKPGYAVNAIINSVSVKRVYASKRNLLIHTGDLAHAAWTPNHVSDVSGALVSFTLAPNRGYITQSPLSGPRTFSVDMKRGSFGYGVVVNSTYASGNYAVFNLDTGVISGMPTASGATASMRYLGNGWYRCSLYYDSAGGTPLSGFSGSSHPTLSTVENSGNIYVRNPQLEEGNNLTPYQKVVSKYDITEGVEKHNLLVNSGGFTTSWLPSQGASVGGTVTGPWSGQEGRTITFAGGGLLRQVTAEPTKKGDMLTGSVWMKAGTASKVTLGVLGSGSGVGQTYLDINLTNEWKRYSITALMPSAGDTYRLRIRHDGQDGTIHVAAAQLEVGSQPTAYQSVGDVWDYQPHVPSVHYLHFDGVDDWMGFAEQIAMKAAASGYLLESGYPSLASLFGRGGQDGSAARIQGSQIWGGASGGDTNDFSGVDGAVYVDGVLTEQTGVDAPHVVRMKAGTSNNKNVKAIGWSFMYRFWKGDIYSLALRGSHFRDADAESIDKALAKTAGVTLP